MARSMIFSVVLHTVLALFTSSTVVLAKNYGELIPGPGLPSLASLNLTTADIYNMISHEIHTDTEHAARPAGCFSPPNPYKDDIFACYYYLANVIPNNGCEGNGPNGISVEYCQSKTAKIRGTNLGPDGQFGSLCKDVAFGINDVVQRCRGFAGDFNNYGGYSVAWGNGDLQVIVDYNG